MIHIASYIKGLLAGIVIGVAGIALLLLYFINSISIKTSKSENDDLLKTKSEINSEDLFLVNEAINHINSFNETFKSAMDPLKGFETTKDSSQIPNAISESGYSITGKSLEQVENDLIESIKENKDKFRNIKAVTSFVSDIVKVFSTISKELSKLSTSALNNSSKSSGTLQQTQAMLFGTSTVEIVDPICDLWWISFATYFNELGLDYEALSDKINNDMMVRLLVIQEELISVEKRLGSEGNKCISLYKDNLTIRDSKLKERDRRREKADNALDPTISTANPIVISVKADPSKVMQKLQHSENALSEQQDRLFQAKKELLLVIPKVINDLNVLTAKAVVETKNVLNNFSASVSVYNKRSIGISEDLRLCFDRSLLAESTSSSSPTNRSSTSNRILSLVRELEKKQSPFINSSNKNSNLINKLDMTHEATNYLAAVSPLTYISSLPQSFGPLSSQILSSESCVWFIALCGRVYRDIASSDYFQLWFCSKLAYLLNKGTRPSFVDDFVVNGVSFGSTPPILTNVKWSPVTSSECNETEPPQKTKNYLGSLDDPEFDVACTGDLSFKSGITFTLSTKFWINWPREHYASIPLTVILKIREVTGPIKFGVRKNCSFLSFIEEPQTRFAMSMEVGDSFNFKLTDIPHVSEYVESKVRKYIRNMFVYPNAHKMRLLWPRPWWPAGTENEFLPNNINVPVNTVEIQKQATDSSTNNTVEKLVDNSAEVAPQTQPVATMKTKLNSWLLKATNKSKSKTLDDDLELQIMSSEELEDDLNKSVDSENERRSSVIFNNSLSSDVRDADSISETAVATNGMSKATVVEEYLSSSNTNPQTSSADSTWFTQIAAKTKLKLNEFKSKHLSNYSESGDTQIETINEDSTEDSSSPSAKTLSGFSKTLLKAKEVFKSEISKHIDKEKHQNSLSSPDKQLAI